MFMPFYPLESYLQAAERENTQRSYASALRHFEVTWGGLLPATTDNVARYLVAHAASLSLNTFRLRLAALSHWHREHEFPGRSPPRRVLPGIRGDAPTGRFHAQVKVQRTFRIAQPQYASLSQG